MAVLSDTTMSFGPYDGLRVQYPPWGPAGGDAADRLAATPHGYAPAGVETRLLIDGERVGGDGPPGAPQGSGP
jgi:hypothetical protein